MKTLPDKSVDLFLCDLPYGCLSQAKGATPFGRNTKGPCNSGCAWDVKIDLEQFWAQVERLMRDDHTPIIHFCTARFGFELIQSKESWFRYDLVWNKNRGIGFLNVNKQPMRSHELIYVFAKKGARYYRKDIEAPDRPPHDVKTLIESKTYNGGKPLARVASAGGWRCVLSVINFSSNQNRRHQHPTQKPDELYEWLIERYSKEGDTILDPTAGSFAAVFTAEKMGRNGIGIEKDVGFYTKANELSAR